MDKGYKDFNKKDLIIDLKVQMNRIESMLARVLNELQPRISSSNKNNLRAWWGTSTPYDSESNPFVTSKSNNEANGPKGEGCCGGSCGN